MATPISSSARVAVAPSFSGTPPTLAQPLPATPLAPPIHSGSAVLEAAPDRPSRMLTAMAILISSLAIRMATPSFSGIQLPLAPPLPATPLPPPIHSASAMLATVPARPSGMPTVMAILISSSAIRVVPRCSSAIPLHWVPHILPMPQPAPIPSASPAVEDAQPSPISTVTAILISSSEMWMATRAYTATPR